MHNRYLFLFLLSQRNNFQATSEGGAQPNISKIKIISTPIPIPPITEQHRIVTQVEELMALCDHLETTRDQREITRKRLTSSSYSRLTAQDTKPNKFTKSTHFILDSLPELTANPDQIKILRQTILDLAVRGNLVKQDPSDEPASDLLRSISQQKKKLIEAKRIKNSNEYPQVEISDHPFHIPTNWEWVRFGNIVDFSAGKTPPRNDPSYWNTGDYAWISIADMKDGEIITSTKETVSTKARNNVYKADPSEAGTMIMSFKLTIGKIAYIGIPAYFNEAIISIHPHISELTPYIFKVLPDLARGGDLIPAIKGATLNRDSISNILFPLPPLSEQRRIVAKVEELMALCNKLEKGLDSRSSIQTRHMETSLMQFNNKS